MFNKDEKRSGGMTKIGQGENETIIGQSVKVDGDFVSEGNVWVQGIVNGSLKTRGDLRVENGSKIKADVEAANALVSGHIKGNITIQNNLELTASAVIEGDIVAKVLSIEPGAILNGHCSVSLGDKVAAASEPALVQRPAKEKA